MKGFSLIRIRSVGYGFQIEMKFTAWRLGYKIVEVPIIFTDRKLGASKMTGGIFNEALWGVLRMKLRSIFTKYPRKVDPPCPLKGVKLHISGAILPPSGGLGSCPLNGAEVTINETNCYELYINKECHNCK